MKKSYESCLYTKIYFNFFYIFREHSFSEIISHCNNLKDLVGPVYDVGHAAHTFSEMKAHVESLKTLMGPIYGDERHK